MRLARVVLNDPQAWWVLKNEKRRTEIVTLIGKLRVVHAVVFVEEDICRSERLLASTTISALMPRRGLHPTPAAMALVMRRAP
jgi:hypothetical protein